jgi:hypothetical protein
MFLVVVDTQSKWLEIDIIPSATSATTATNVCYAWHSWHCGIW